MIMPTTAIVSTSNGHSRVGRCEGVNAMGSPLHSAGDAVSGTRLLPFVNKCWSRKRICQVYSKGRFWRRRDGGAVCTNEQTAPAYRPRPLLDLFLRLATLRIACKRSIVL